MHCNNRILGSLIRIKVRLLQPHTYLGSTMKLVHYSCLRGSLSFDTFADPQMPLPLNFCILVAKYYHLVSHKLSFCSRPLHRRLYSGVTMLLFSMDHSVVSFLCCLHIKAHFLHISACLLNMLFFLAFFCFCSFISVFLHCAAKF